MPVAKKRKKNPPDVTMRNIESLKRQIKKLTGDVEFWRQRGGTLENTMNLEVMPMLAELTEQVRKLEQWRAEGNQANVPETVGG